MKNLFLFKIVIILILQFPVNSFALDSYSLFINTAEGGETSNRKVIRFKDFLNQNDCPISNIKLGSQSLFDFNFDFVFNPLDFTFNNDYKKIANISVLNSENLSTSILVRASTGIENLSDLDDVRMAYLSPNSITGFKLPQAMLLQQGVKLSNDKITYTQTNVGALSLLLHKDVFAAAVATPLANKWANANDLSVVSVSQRVDTGGIWAKNNLEITVINKCQVAFDLLSVENRENIKLFKIFPAWISRFKSIK